MKEILNLERYPLDREGSPEWQQLVDRCIADLHTAGMFNLEDFLLPGVAPKAAAEIAPLMATQSYLHKRVHNIYFKPSIPELPEDHPALRTVETINHTVCADQMPESLVLAVYQYPPFARFLAATMGKPVLHLMEDPLARANVIAYGQGEALNWHFDRAEFTTTLLLQAAQAGGEFEYRSDLRTEQDPNYAGVARLLRGEDPQLQRLHLKAGTLNVFKGKNTAHRVTPVQGDTDRMIAVFSYYEKPGVVFTAQERMGFYGRAA